LEKEHWYEHVPKSAETSHESKVNLLCNQKVKTDRTAPKNNPDILIRDNEKNFSVNTQLQFKTTEM
jgi:hypothetical protein